MLIKMKKVLVIEDDKTLRENTKELLGFLNYSVIVARDGIEGVELAIKHLPNIILCDVLMPHLDGYGVYQSLAKLKTTRSIPFIFMSARTEPADIRKGMIMGADDYITKPFTEQDLIETIESRLAKHAILIQNQTLKEVEPGTLPFHH